MLKATIFSAALLAGTFAFAQQQQDSGAMRPGNAGGSSGAITKDAAPGNTNVNANTNGTATTQPSERYANLSDSQFVSEAGSGGLAEVELGQLARQNASSVDVKNLGDHMVTDHSKANAELRSAASKAGYPLPSEINAQDKANIERLKALKGDDFDRAYVRLMIDDHRHDIRLFKAEANRDANADLKAFATNTLPTLRNHLQMAKDVAGKVGVDVGNEGAEDNAQPAAGRIEGNQGQPNTPNNGQGVVQPEGQTK